MRRLFHRLVRSLAIALLVGLAAVSVLRSEDGRAPDVDAIVTLPAGQVVPPGADVVVPVHVDPVDGAIAFDLGFTYDSSVLQPVAAYRTGFTQAFTLVPNLGIDGEVYLALFNSQTLVGPGDVVWVTFTAIGAAGTGSDLTWLYGNLNEGSIPSTLSDGRVDIVAADATLSVPDCASGPPGATVWVPVEAATADGFQDVDATVAYDSDLLTATAVQTTALSAACSLAETIDVAAGRVDVTLTCPAPLAGSGPLVEIAFQVVGFLGDEAPLDLALAQVNSGAISIAIDDGLFVVGTDADSDGSSLACGDCDDTDADVYPGAPELCDGQDNQCPGDPGYGQVDESPDSDGDGVADCDDACPADPGKTAPGICGCGVSDADTDGDTVVDCLDTDDDNDGVDDVADCAPLVNSVWALPGDLGASLRLGPTTADLTWDNMAQANVFDLYRGTRDVANDFVYSHACLVSQVPVVYHVDPTQPGPSELFYYLVGGRNSCDGGSGTLGYDSLGAERPIDAGCPVVGLDQDGDGVANIDDNCPLESNAGQADGDGDGLGDVCDLCPATADPTNRDRDGDGQGDACDACTDVDGDGFGDPGSPADVCSLDNCPGAPNPTQADTDADGIGDACDACPSDSGNDADNDGVCGDEDNCPSIANSGQGDFDADGLGDACDSCTDGDGDGLGDPGFPANQCAEDNCPTTPNTGQADLDGDGRGDACDNCPLAPNAAQVDGDADGIGDTCDPCVANPDTGCVACPDPTTTDIDGDGVCDVGTVVLSEGTLMRYLVNTADPGIAMTWTDPAFSDGSWFPGFYGIGYDADNDAYNLITTFTVFGASSIYTRTTFVVPDPAAIEQVLLAADWDDGYVVWINGTEVFRSPQVPAGPLDWDTIPGSHESSNGSAPDFSQPEVVTGAPLLTGTNRIAIGVWNRSSASTDLVLVPQLTLKTSVDNCPGSANPGQEDTDGDGIGDACDPG